MTTLLIHTRPDGTHRRICGANCHNATKPHCVCICQGVNHGVGINQAIDNTQHHAHLLADAQDPGRFIITNAQYQLFEEKKL